MPDGIMGKTDNRELHALGHLYRVSDKTWETIREPYLAESLRLGVFLKAESREMHAGAEDLCFCENTDTPDTVDFHLHVRVAVRVAQVCQVGSPSGILRIAFDNDSVLVKCVGQGKRRLGLLPGIEIIRLLSSEPVRQGSPDI
jgi:hypothetical protein